MVKKKKRPTNMKRGEQHKTAVQCDSYDQTAFSRLKDRAVKLQELEENGSQKLSTFPPLMQDVYSSLYKSTPKLREERNIVSSHRYNRSLVEQMMKTEQFKELRNYTKLDEFNAAMATLSLADQALALVPAEIQKKAQEMNNIEEQIESQEDQIASTKTFAGQMKAKAKVLQQQADAVPRGQRSKAAPLQLEASKLKIEAENMENSVKEAELSLEEAKKKLEEFDFELEEQIENSAPQLRQAARKAAEKALEEVKETSDLLEVWGDDAGNVQEMPVEEKIKRANILQSSNKMKELAKLVGRFKRLAINTQKTKIKEIKTEVFDVVRGSDLSRVLPSELNILAHQNMRLDFYKRYAQENLLIYDKKDKEKVGKGPIIVCCDNSGSMQGQKEFWSKAVALAMLEIAKMQKRNFACIHFGSDNEPLKVIEVPKGKANFETAYELGSYFLNGGTSFMKPLNETVNLIEKQEFKKADIIFITDGECSVTDEFLRKFKETKKQKEFKVISVLVDMGSTTPTAVAEFSDDVKFVSQLSDEEARGIFEAI